MTVKAGYTGMLYVAPGPSLAFTKTAMTADGNRDTYTCTAASKRYWDLDYPVLVYVDNVLVTTGYTVQYCGGVVVFDTPLNVGQVVTVSGQYFTYSKAAGIKSYSLKLGRKLGTSTVYTDTAEEYTALGKSGSGSLTLIDMDDYFDDILGDRVVAVFHMDGTYNANDSTGSRWEAYIRFTNWAYDLPVNELMSESHDFVVTNERHYRAA